MYHERKDIKQMKGYRKGVDTVLTLYMDIFRKTLMPSSTQYLPLPVLPAADGISRLPLL